MKLWKFWKKSSSEKKNKEPTKKSAKKAAKAAKRQAKKEAKEAAKKAAKATKCQAKKQEPQPQCSKCAWCKQVDKQKKYYEQQVLLREKHHEDTRMENMRLQQELLSLTEGTSYSLSSFIEGRDIQNTEVSNLLYLFGQWTQQVEDAVNPASMPGYSNSSTTNKQQTPTVPSSEAAHPPEQADSNSPVQFSNQLTSPSQPIQAPVSTVPVPPAPTASVSAAAVHQSHRHVDPIYMYYYERYYQHMGTDPDIATQLRMPDTYPNAIGQHNIGPDRKLNTVQPQMVNVSQDPQHVEVMNPTAYEEMLVGESLMSMLNGESIQDDN